MNLRFTFFARLLLSATLLTGVAGAHAAQSVPSFVQGPLFNPNTAAVHSVESSPNADFVLLSGGADVGFQNGMLCRVVRGNETIGEVIIVKVTRHHAAALILGLAPSQIIEAGDIARLKTL